MDTEFSPAPMMTALGSIAVAAGPKTRRMLTGAVIASAAYGSVKRIWDTRKARLAYTVTVNQGDPIYSELHGLLLDMLASPNRRALLACTEYDRQSSSSLEVVPEHADREGQLVLLFDGGVAQTVNIEGHQVRVDLVKPEVSNADLMRENYGTSKIREQLRLTAQSEAGRDVVLTLLAEVVKEHYRKKKSRFLVASQWGSFEDRRDLPLRRLDTVVLRSGQKERLIQDLSLFLSQEAEYARLGAPWHRGVLLHGPPGSGKTSLAKAVACYFNLDVYYVPIGDLKSDTSLLQLCSQVQPGAMLLLEDVDILQAATTREDEQGRTSLSGLLNALDGVSTPHGLITVLTTNDMSKLDSALIRPGRVDLIEEIGHLDDDGLASLFALAFGSNHDHMPSVDGLEVTPAEVMEIFKRNLDDPIVALAELESLIKGRFAC